MNKESIYQWFKKDFVYIIVLLVALIGCIYTLGSVQKYQNQCNNHWIKQIGPLVEKYNGDINTYIPFNASYNIGNLLQNEIY